MIKRLLSFLAYNSRFTKKFAEHDYKSVFQRTLKDLEPLGFDIEGKRVLDLGCGKRYQFALLCAAANAHVTALDIEYVKPDFLPYAICHTFTREGMKRAVRLGLQRLLYDRMYYSCLQNLAGKPVRAFRSKIDFIVADPEGGNYPIPSCSFELIAANAVVEHVTNVPKFASEICRLLVPGGYFYTTIHNFYSLSGGHRLEWAYPDEHPFSRVPPWDHLRKNMFPSMVYLNKLRPEEYKKIFSEYLDVLLFEGRDLNCNSGKFEGEHFLTAEIKVELSNFCRELLLIRTWCMICQKKK